MKLHTSTASGEGQPARSQSPERSDIGLILALAFVGAGVDAVFIMGFNVLTAAQTGNTILMAAALARGDLATGLSAAISVLAYVGGAALGEFVQVTRLSGRSGLTKALVFEILLLGAAAIMWKWVGTVPSQGFGLMIVSLAALAMGVQSAAVRGLHAAATTTYVTGVLTNFTTGLVEWLLPYSWGTSPPAAAGRKPADSPWTNGIVWVTYLGGAVLNGLLFLRVGELALLAPVVVLGAVIARRFFLEKLSGRCALRE